MKVLVLGAGVSGVSSAWYLAKSGHEVTVIDRHDAAGEETSFANGGQISVSHAQPWANPQVPAKILRWLGREDAPLLFRLRADRAQWRWGLAFLRECTAARHAHNTRQLVTLGLYSRASLQALRAETGIEYHQLARGNYRKLARELERLGALMAVAGKPSFNCAAARRPAEKTICANPELANLDRQIHAVNIRVVREAQSARERQALQREQDDFIARRNADFGKPGYDLLKVMRDRLQHLLGADGY